jgi:hypothetical protein
MKYLYILLLAASLFLAGNVFADNNNDIVWRPVTPEELQMKTPKVEPGADAEAIFWDVTLDDKKADKLSYNHYVRVKIFTERGREKFSKFDIPFTKGKKVEDVAARVIKPDGTIITLNPSDIFEREIVKKGKLKVLAKSFAVPGIEPGVIVEYQYREVFKDDGASGERLIFQRDIPMQKVTYHVRPYRGMTLGYNYFNMPDTRFIEDPSDKGYYVATMTNVPAYKDEPYMPPDDEVRKWVYLQYQTLGSMFSWNNVSRNYSMLLTEFAKPTKLVKQKASELTANTGTDTEKLSKIYAFTQKEIKNISYDSTFTDEQREKVKVGDMDDVLKKGMGASVYIDLLFASLARAAGYEVNIVLSGDRSENFFDREKYPYPSFIHPACIAVKVGDTWRFFNPGTPYLPFEFLLWNEEGVNAMLVGDTGHIWGTTPLTDQTRSVAKRSGTLKLLEDGTLEGKVKLEYFGHQAINRRKDDLTDSPAKREENIKTEFKAQMSAAEITDISVENFDDNTKPLTYIFNVRVPNYAQKTGKRLFVQPGFFEYGSNPVFASATRTYSIYFPYPWSEEDSINIQFPAGYDLDNADAPAELHDTGKISGLKITIGVDKTANTLIYHRNFYFGGGKNIIFPLEAYPAIKNLFDGFYKADTHVITLKQK